eukprot:559847_1
MFDLQSLCTNRSRPDWISTANMMQLEQTAKSVDYLWSKRNIITYPQSHVDVDSSESLYCDLNHSNGNIYIEECRMEDIVRFNDLLPPITRDGELSHLCGYNLTRSLPQHTINMEMIQVHIQFTDRSYEAIQNTMKQSSDYDKYLLYKRKKRRLRELTANNPKIRQSKRIRNKLHREIYSFSQLDDSDHHSSDIDPPFSNGLNLPDLEPQPTQNGSKKAVSEDSVSSMSISPDMSNHKRKANGEPARKKRKIEMIDNAVIGDSEAEETLGGEHNDAIGDSNSFIYEMSFDDFRLDLFVRLFPQLLVTHHLVYCKQSFEHYYYQNYFSSAKNQYEWIQTDMQLVDVYHRYMDDHFGTADTKMDAKKYNDFKNTKIVMFFQIRPRSDTKSDEEAMQHHKQLLMDSLIQLKCDDEGDITDEDTFYMSGDVVDDEHQIMCNFYSRDHLVSNVIREIYEQQSQSPEVCLLPGSWESGLCAFCHKKFSTKRRSEEEWIECEFCGKWYHVMCSGLTSKGFEHFQTKQNYQYHEENMIGCDYCPQWYHYYCVQLSSHEANLIDEYKCPACKG